MLRPGARLVVELMHRDRLVRGFAEQDWRLLGEGRLLLEQRTFDAAAGVAQTTQTLIDGGGERESRTFTVRVYSATELAAMLGRAGFADVRCYGDLEGVPFDVEHAPRRRRDQPVTWNESVSSAFELLPAKTSICPGSTTNLPLLSWKPKSLLSSVNVTVFDFSPGSSVTRSKPRRRRTGCERLATGSRM